MLSSVDKILETSADHNEGDYDQDDDVDGDGDDDPGVHPCLHPHLAVSEQVPLFGEVLPVYIRGGGGLLRACI